MDNNNESKDNVEQVCVSLDKPIDPSIHDKMANEITSIRKAMLAIVVSEGLRIKAVCDEHGLKDVADKSLCVVPQKMYEVMKSMLEGEGACVVIDERQMAAVLKPVFSLLNVLLVTDDIKRKGIIK